MPSLRKTQRRVAREKLIRLESTRFLLAYHLGRTATFKHELGFDMLRIELNVRNEVDAKAAAAWAAISKHDAHAEDSDADTDIASESDDDDVHDDAASVVNQDPLDDNEPPVSTAAAITTDHFMGFVDDLVLEYMYKSSASQVLSIEKRVRETRTTDATTAPMESLVCDLQAVEAITLQCDAMRARLSGADREPHASVHDAAREFQDSVEHATDVLRECAIARSQQLCIRSALVSPATEMQVLAHEWSQRIMMVHLQLCDEQTKDTPSLLAYVTLSDALSGVVAHVQSWQDTQEHVYVPPGEVQSAGWQLIAWCHDLQARVLRAAIMPPPSNASSRSSSRFTPPASTSGICSDSGDASVYATRTAL